MRGFYYSANNCGFGLVFTEVDRALQKWNAVFGKEDQSLAIGGKTMCNAIDEQGQQAHIMSVIGHESAQCYTQKKSAHCRQ